CPCEILHAVGDVPMCRGAVPVGGACALRTRRADGPWLRHGQGDIVPAELVECACIRMQLMTVPAVVLQHANLRKPVGDDECTVDHTGAIERTRHMRVPRELDLD